MPTFYQLDSTRVTFREYVYGTPWYLLPLAFLLKVLRIRLPGSSDDPAVEEIAPFEVAEPALPEDVRTAFAPVTAELTALGFHSPIYHLIEDPVNATRTCWATFLHRSGKACARIHHRRWAEASGPRIYFFPQFLSVFDDGTALVSSAANPDLFAPRSCTMNYRTGAAVVDLWAAHDQALLDLLPRQPALLTSHEPLRDTLEKHHAALRDFHRARGVFRPLTEEQQQKLAEQPPVAAASAPTDGPSDDEVLRQLEQLQTSQGSWWNALFILALSLVLFVAAGWVQHSWELVWMLIPILAFHELGHYVTMRLFGYRNVRMFFIPFFGAAVSGKSYNVAGWKKVLVALAGPVPGIAAGIGIGLLALFQGHPSLLQAALLTIVLNGLNLVPMLPFDGGWVVHIILFQRHPLLDTLFRLLTILGLFAAGMHFEDWILKGLAIVMLIGLPTSWRLAKVAHRLRRHGELAISPNDQLIPREVALPILAEVRSVMPKRIPANLLAAHVLRVFEMCNARPPGFFASTGLLLVHVGSLVVALVFMAVLLLGEGGDLLGTATLLGERPEHAYTPGSVQQWRGPEAPARLTDQRLTLAVTFKREATAQQEFEALTAELPRQATLVRFGPSLLLTLPEDRDAERAQWTARLGQQAKDIVADRPEDGVTIRLFCIAPDNTAARRIDLDLWVASRSPTQGMLIPPWSAAWQALPAEQRQRYERARRTLARLDRLHEEAQEDPEVKAAQKRLNRFFERVDPEEWKERIDTLNKLLEAEMQRLREELREDPEVDPQMCALWEQRHELQQENMNNVMAAVRRAAERAGPMPRGQAPEQDAEPAGPTAQLLKAVQQQMAEQLGVLPAKGDNAEAARFLMVTRRQSYLLVTGSFLYPSQGLPALADWLAQEGCKDIRFGFVRPAEFADEEER